MAEVGVEGGAGDGNRVASFVANGDFATTIFVAIPIIIIVIMIVGGLGWWRGLVDDNNGNDGDGAIIVVAKGDENDSVRYQIPFYGNLVVKRNVRQPFQGDGSIAAADDDSGDGEAAGGMGVWADERDGLG